MAKKRGVFSTEELDYLRSHKDTATIEQMAEALSRTPESVKDNILKIDLSFRSVEENKKFERELKKRPYWKNLKKQYTEEELELYEYHWVKYVQQFQDDITHAEESQILKAIDLEMMLDRNKLEHTKTEKAINKLQDALDEELDKDDASRDKGYIMNLQNNLMSLRAGVQSGIKIYNELLGKYQDLMKALKSTRDQRFKDIEKKDVTFFGWLKKLSDKKQRDRLSMDMEKMNHAILKMQNEFGQYHTYEDGELDRPLLNAEIVELGEESNDGQN